jgi:hypothetical protein
VNYQDNVNAPLQREDDIEVAPEEDDDTESVSVDSLEKVQTAVQKVGQFTCLLCSFLMMLQLRKIIRSVRSSPQRRQNWLIEVSQMNAGKPPLMLILDVKTRWSSTHQMLRRFLIFLSIKMNRYQLSQVAPWITVNL